MAIVGYLLFVALFVVGVVSLTAAFVLMWRQAGHEARPWSDRTTMVLALAAVAWTVAAGSYLLFAPLVMTGSDSGAMFSDGSTVVHTRPSTQSLLASEGSGVVVVVLIPVGFVLVAALVRGRWAKPTRLAVGVTLLAGCTLSMLTIGVFYLPAVLLLGVAGLKTQRARRQPRTRSPRVKRTGMAS